MESRQKHKSLNYAELEELYEQTARRKGARSRQESRTVEGRHPSWPRKRDDYLKNHLIGLGPAAIEGLKTKMASYDYSILGHQISVNAYNIVDRCEVCHAGIREPLDLTSGESGSGWATAREPIALRARFRQPSKQRNPSDSQSGEVWLCELSLGQRPRDHERCKRSRAAPFLALADV